jgi:CubicO group peptidase (beta-lactamase class C family)
MRSGRRDLARRLLGVFLAVLSSPALAQTVAPAGDTARLLGLWGTTRSFGPEIRGELTVFRAGDGWRATIGGTSAPVRMNGDSVTFTLAANPGSFRGYRDAAGKRIRGHWIQPAGAATGVAWATPVELRPVAAGTWRGIVLPLEESVTLYMDVRADSGGVVRAVFRNPDGNFGNARFTLAAQGAHFKLLSIDNGATLLEGDYDEKHDRLLLPIPDGLPLPELRTTLELARQTRDRATGYYPRTPAEGRYLYRPPIAEGDGWPTAILGAAGLDETRISELVQKILDTDPWPQTAPLVQSLLIARHGKLVLEEYFYGFDKERPHDLRSAGKTLASVLVGIAIDRGAKFGPQTPVYSLFPEYKSFANPDPRKKFMTVEHLMTMTSGFDCDENGNDNAPGNEDKMQSQTAQPDWYKFMLDQPLSAGPGDVFAYCSGGVNLVGGIVRNTTRTWLPEFFDRHFARPLSLRTYHMNLTPTGEGYLGGGLRIRPRDALKLGQVYLDGGVWNGKRIVSKKWVEVSTALHPMNAHGKDGYDWHLNDIKLGDRVFKEYDASGNGGQLVMVLPELDLVVLFTGGNYGNFGVWRHFRDELLPQYILAAVKDR